MYFYDSQAMDIATQKNLVDLKARVHAHLAVCFEFSGVYDSSIYHHIKAIEIYEDVDSLRKKLITAYHNLSTVYSSSENGQKALEYTKKSLSIAQELKSNIDIPYAYFNIGFIHHGLEHYDSAQVNYRKTIYSFPSDSISYLKLAAFANLGKVFLELEQLDSSNKYFQLYQEGSKIYPDSSMYNNMHVSRTLFEYNLKTKNYGQAQKNLKRALGYARTLDMPTEIAIEYDNYASYYKDKGIYDSALYYYTKSQELSDSIESAEVRNKIVEIETKYQTAKKENKILELESEAEVNQAQNNLLSLATISLIVIMIIVLAFFTINRRKSKELAKQNIIIQKSYKEIEDLIRESHHRIKNNLQVVSSLLKMQSKNVKSDEARSSLVEAFNRVKTITLLHQRLQGSQTFKVIKMEEFIGQLVDNIKHSVTNSDSNIAIKTQIESVEVDTDQSISIGLIINELITNSIKYAFPNKSGEISITLKVINNKLELEIADNGIGFPEDFDPQSGKSLGFKIVKSLSIKLKAEMLVSNENGAHVKILIPQSQLVSSLVQ